MTHSLSVTAADNPPAMWLKATFATVVSSTSMKVGTMTAKATIHGLKTRGLEFMAWERELRSPGGTSRHWARSADCRDRRPVQPKAQQKGGLCQGRSSRGQRV